MKLNHLNISGSITKHYSWEGYMNKVMLMVLVGLVIAVGNVQACDKCSKGYDHKAPAGEAVDEKLDKMTKDLNLSPEQGAQVQVILEEKMVKKQKILDEKHAAMQALHEEFQANLKEVLSAEQMKQWEARKDYCPDCKDGKLCKKCKLKKSKKERAKESKKAECPCHHGRK